MERTNAIGLALIVGFAVFAFKTSIAKFDVGDMVIYKGEYCTIYDRKSLFYQWSYKLRTVSGEDLGWIPEKALI